MNRRVYDFIRQQHMVSEGMRIMVAFSGGKDSTALLDLLQSLENELGIRICAAHVEHGIRGEESLSDLAFCRNFCEERGIPFASVQVDAPKKAAKDGISLEEAARLLRYEALALKAKEFAADRIALAHHMDDQAETVLFHLLRGSGLKGLCGMQSIRDIYIRPLLCVTRDEIEAYVETRGLSFCTDSTNADPAYSRNFIRQELLPLAEEHLFAHPQAQIARAASRLSEVQAYVTRQTEKACAKALTGEGEILTDAYLKEEPLIRKEILKVSLEQHLPGLKDLTSRHIEALDELAGKQSGSGLDLPGGVRAEICYGHMRFFKAERSDGREHFVGRDCETLETRSTEPGGANEQPDSSYAPEIPGTLMIGGKTWIFSLISAENVDSIPQNTYTKWFDYDKIVRRLLIRHRMDGDYLEINAHHGTKKLKDYLINEKVPREKRDALYLLADGAHVLWIPGMRISEAYKVTEGTRTILEVRMTGGNSHD